MYPRYNPIFILALTYKTIHSNIHLSDQTEAISKIFPILHMFMLFHNSFTRVSFSF